MHLAYCELDNDRCHHLRQSIEALRQSCSDKWHRSRVVEFPVRLSNNVGMDCGVSICKGNLVRVDIRLVKTLQNSC